MIEIATLTFERFLLTRRLGLKPGRGYVFGGALGLERIAAAAARVGSLFEVPELRRLVESVKGNVEPKLAEVGMAYIRQVADAVRTLSVIAGRVGTFEDKGRRQRVHRLLKTLYRSSTALGIPDPADTARALVDITSAEVEGVDADLVIRCIKSGSVNPSACSTG